MTDKPIEFTASQLGVIGLLIIFALIFIRAHIIKRDDQDKLQNWRKPE